MLARRETVAALEASYPNQEAAADAIALQLREFYREQYYQTYIQRRQDVERAVRATQTIYRRNIFPDMNIRWGTYLNDIGHMDAPGCFRCHDDNHKSKDGESRPRVEVTAAGKPAIQSSPVSSAADLPEKVHKAKPLTAGTALATIEPGCLSAFKQGGGSCVCLG
ncbi:MAG: hypothetical protein HYS05_06670 [Acidobacteria bacterium]|nr:hypothetical protein [Acidobacteriota bacterium]